MEDKLLPVTSTDDLVFDGKVIDDDEAKKNVNANKLWMEGGYIHKTHKEDLGKAFEIVYADIDKSEGANGEVEDLVAGPAVLWALLGNIMTWTTFVVVTFVSTYLVDVNEVGVAKKTSRPTLGLRHRGVVGFHIGGTHPRV